MRLTEEYDMPKTKIPYQKLVTAADGHIVTRMFLNMQAPIVCSGCGGTIGTNDYMQGCNHCDHVFCETCITNGTFERHRDNCEHEYDEE